MTLRTKHGAAAAYSLPGETTQETLPVNELPEGTPEQADDVSRAAAEETGRFGPANRRSVLGGRAHRGKPRMVARVALASPGETLATARYHRAAVAFGRAVSSTLAATIGGGHLDPHVGYLVNAAARAAKWANYYSDSAERMAEGSKEQLALVQAALGADEKASTHLRNAHEYAAKMAEAHAKARGPVNFAKQLGIATEEDDDDGST